jgi:hypothetical protein
MRFHRFASMLVAVVLFGVMPLTAVQGPPQTPPPPPGKPQEAKPAPKEESKPATAASLAGRWAASVEGADGTLSGWTLELKTDPKDDKKLVGTIVGEIGEAVVAGEVVEGKLTFRFTLDVLGDKLSGTVVGTLQKDASLAGTLQFESVEMPLRWTAVRIKG